MPKTDNSFREHIGGFFHDLLKAAGITMLPGTATERIRTTGERMAAAIEHTAEQKAIAVIKRLQKAVSAAFVKMEEELAVQKAIIVNTLSDREKAEEQIKALTARVEALEKTKLLSNKQSAGPY